MAATNKAIKPPAKCTKCDKVKTYKKEPATLLPSPVKYTPIDVNSFQPFICK